MGKTLADEVSDSKREMWEKKVELKRLNDIAFLIKDQINRLKVEELSLQNIMANEDVGSQASFGTGTQSTTSQDSAHEINRINLDLSVLPSVSSSQETVQFQNETSWEEEDEDSNECVLNL